MRPAYNIWLQV